MQMIDLKDLQKKKKDGIIKKIKEKISYFRKMLKTYKELYQFMGIITTQFSAYKIDKINPKLSFNYMKVAKEYTFLVCEKVTETFINVFQDNYDMLTLDLKILAEETLFIKTWKRYLKENSEKYNKLKNKMKKSVEGDYFS